MTQTDGHGGLELGLIGNSRVAALVNRLGSLVWWCYPNFDGDPVFSRLLAGDEDKGSFDCRLEGMVDARSDYLRNTAVIRTTLTDGAGNAVRITDFAPRFRLYGRNFQPAQLCRLIEPVNGLPRITLRLRPTHGYGLPRRAVAGSNHIRYLGAEDAVRLTTNAPLSYLERETPFALTRPLHMVIGVDEPLEGATDAVVADFLKRTADYWHDWVRTLAVPFEWQEVCIRAAITLKLSSYEETGAIVAALTTSIPEAPGSGRNWDYRYCWLRDAYFVIQALNRLGATRTMERYVDFIATVASGGADLKPLYGIVPDLDLTERIEPNLAGYLGDGPVRVGNQAAEQVQHDVYGSVVLAVAQTFFDERLPAPGDAGMFRRLEPLAERAAKLAFEPDAGIWEYRGRQRLHTHSALLCWVACHRMGLIARRLRLATEAGRWEAEAQRLRERILREAWSECRQCFTGTFGHDSLDASVLLMHEMGLIAADDPRFIATVEVIGRELDNNGHLMRYSAPDDFGTPETAFLVVKFWYLDALAAIGRRDEARALYDDLVALRNRYGLLAEDVHPQDGRLWGNIPQTYSMAGLINTAMKLSRSWEEGMCQGSW